MMKSEVTSLPWRQLYSPVPTVPFSEYQRRGSSNARKCTIPSAYDFRHHSLFYSHKMELGNIMGVGGATWVII